MNLVKQRLVALTGAYYSIGLIKFKEKNLFHKFIQIKAGIMLSICLNFHQNQARYAYKR